MTNNQHSDKISYELQNYLEDTFRHEIKRDVLNGLTSAKKSIPSKYFYDEKGSRIFDEICNLPEYYPTRTELSILKNAAEGIMANFQGGDIIELGSGANRKIRMLLDAAGNSGCSSIRYIPVDVSQQALTDAVEELISIYPELEVLCIVADFIHHINVIPNSRPKLIVFFGGTIGNLDEEESISFLRSVRRIMKRGDRFLFGLDMIKSKEVLEAAYNDSQGTTAEFNRNILHVINRELNANFSSSFFDHVAFFNSEKERVEMHLKTSKDISVDISDLDFKFELKEGETIHTEICRKFSRESAGRMISEAGMAVTNWHTDPKGWFSLVEVATLNNNPERTD
jgi:L-histidine N-alpha-methyltransferase